MTNKSGERGPPYLTPHLHLNCLPNRPFRSTEDDPVGRISLIQAIHFASKPLCWRIYKISSCSTVSKAFAKSSFKMMMGIFDCLHWCIYSKAQPRLSWIALLFKNPYWFLWMHWRMTFWSLFAKILVRNFRHVLVREIGLKSSGPSGDSIFGMRVMREPLIFSSDNFP